MGRGLGGVPEFHFTGLLEVTPTELLHVGEHVSEAQMVALFGEGRHPNADAIERALIAEGVPAKQMAASTRLGNPFPTSPMPTSSRNAPPSPTGT